MHNVSLERIVSEIKKRGLTAYELSRALPLSEVGINKILNGTSASPRKSTLILLHNYLFTETQTKENEKTPPEEVRFEDVIVRKVLEEIGPLLNERTEKIIEAVMRMHSELIRIQIAQEKAAKSLKAIEERV